MQEGYAIIWGPQPPNNPPAWDVQCDLFLTYEEAEEAAEDLCRDEDEIEFEWPYLIVWLDLRAFNPERRTHVS